MKTIKGLMVCAKWAPKPEYELNEVEKSRHLAYRSNMVWKNPIWEVESEIPILSPKPNQVLIKVASCEVCGSDVHMLIKNADGYMFFAGEAAFPVIIDHEFAGEIIEVGKEVKKLKVGDLVCPFIKPS